MLKDVYTPTLLWILFILTSSMLVPNSVIGQCQRMEWIDHKQTTHSGSYYLHSFPDSKYSFQNEMLKKGNVAEVTLVDSTKKVLSKKAYDKSGFLKFEMRNIDYFDNPDYKELHYYSYGNSNLTVIDSILHLTYKIDEIMLTPVKNARRDTIYHKEIRFYDSNNKLVKGYNLFQNGFYKSYFQGRSFVPDSFFYQYDSCGNCTEIIWYLQGNKSIKTQKLYYHTPAMQILVDGPGYPSEVWKFNTLGQLTQLITEEHKIEINYHQKEMVHFYIYEDLKSSYYSHSPSSSLYIIRYTYHYDSNNRLIKVKEQKYDKVKRTTIEKWVTINWYPNGLIRNDFEGNVFTYIYHKN